MIVGIYVGVSSKEQKIDSQLKELREYAGLRKFRIYQEYVDLAQSGRKDSRPALNQLMDDAKKRKFGAVLVWRFDRFGRSLKHLVQSLDEFNHLGIGFLSYSEGIDTSTPTGRMIFQIAGAFAEFERNVIKSRVKAGIEAARAKGRRMGRPRQIDASRASLLRSQDYSLSQIGKMLKVSKSTVSKCLSSMALNKPLKNTDFNGEGES